MDKKVIKNFFFETFGLYKKIENRRIIRQKIIKKSQN